jgi:hypothetical protein
MGIMSYNGLTRHVGFWVLFVSIMHIFSVAIMFLATIFMIVLSIKPKLKQLISFTRYLALHSIGCIGNLVLLWILNKDGKASEQFSLIATVVPGLLDGIMFVVLFSIYCKKY